MPAKKTKKKVAAKKPVVKAAPVMEHKCECGGHCHCHGSAHWLKHVLVWAIIFALGMVVGKMLCFGPKHHMMPKMHPVFVNGCLDMASVKCPMMQEKLATADVNGDNCVSVEEYKAIKKQMRHMKKPMRGPHMGEPKDMPAPEMVD